MSHHKGNTTLNRQIIVVDGGWVFIAESVEDKGTHLALNTASVIRVWGTTAGLGEIALKGATKDTIYDYCGNPTIPAGKVLVQIPCTYTR